MPVLVVRVLVVVVVVVAVLVVLMLPAEPVLPLSRAELALGGLAGLKALSSKEATWAEAAAARDLMQAHEAGRQPHSRRTPKQRKYKIEAWKNVRSNPNSHPRPNPNHSRSNTPSLRRLCLLLRRSRVSR